MSKDQRETALVVISGVMLAAWLGYVGYAIWRDFDLKRQAAEFAAKVAKRQEEIKERLDVGHWEGEL